MKKDRMVDLSMRLFGDGYWWEFEADAKNKELGKGSENFCRKMVWLERL